MRRSPCPSTTLCGVILTHDSIVKLPVSARTHTPQTHNTTKQLIMPSSANKYNTQSSEKTKQDNTKQQQSTYTFIYIYIYHPPRIKYLQEKFGRDNYSCAFRYSQNSSGQLFFPALSSRQIRPPRIRVSPDSTPSHQNLSRQPAFLNKFLFSLSLAPGGTKFATCRARFTNPAKGVCAGCKGMIKVQPKSVK